MIETKEMMRIRAEIKGLQKELRKLEEQQRRYELSPWVTKEKYGNR